MPKISKPRKHGKKWQINYTNGHGKRCWPTFKTYKEARIALHRLVAEAEAVRSGAAVQVETNRTFADLAELWPEIKYDKRTLKDDRIRIRLHLTPMLGPLRLIEITPLRIAKLKRELSSKMKTGTVRQVLSLLRSMLNIAVEQRWLARALKIRLPPTETRPYRWIKSAEDHGRLLQVAREDGYPGLEPFYATALYTGMRAGELCGLHWSDIDFGLRLITVQRSFDGPTKTNAVRHVPILDPLLPLLDDWFRVGFHNTLVFANKRGNMHPRGAWVTKTGFHACLERAGIEPVRFHDLRHTFASHWVQRGGSLYLLQKILGHKNIKTTQQYAHLAPDAFREDWGRLKAPIYGTTNEAKVLNFPAGLKPA